MIRPIGIAGYRKIAAGERVKPSIAAGSLALDGERELSFSEQDDVTMWVEEAAFRTVDVAAVMQAAAREGLMRHAADKRRHSAPDNATRHSLPLESCALHPRLQRLLLGEKVPEGRMRGVGVHAVTPQPLQVRLLSEAYETIPGMAKREATAGQAAAPSSGLRPPSPRGEGNAQRRAA